MTKRTARRTLLLSLTVTVLCCGCHVLAVPVATALFRPPESARNPADLGLTYHDRIFRGASGARLPAWQISADGGGTPRGLVLILAENGGTRAGARLLWLASVVADRGFDALLVDLRGHGVSSGVNTYGLGETRDLLEVLAVLRRESPERGLAAVGFSLGAACILRAMSVTDAIEAAVVFAPYARLDAPFLRHELDYQTEGRPLARAASRLVWVRLLGVSLRLWAGFPRLPEPVELRTTRPVLLYHAVGDPEIPYRHAQEILAAADAPGLRHVPVDRPVHIPAFDDREVWEPFARDLVVLLDRIFPIAGSVAQ